MVWGTQVNPGGTRGGIEWESAVDGGRVTEGAVDAPSIVNGMVFWGDGYGNIGPANSKLYAFGLKAR